MAVEIIEFDDLPEDDDFSSREKEVNVTIKVSESTRDMFKKIAHRERRNMVTLGTLIVEDYINNYVNSYKKSIKGEQV